MATFPVKWYSESMGGIPQISTANGSLTTLLDAVLVNGFNIKSISSITINGTSADINIGSSHGFLLNQIVLISGANESFWNSEFRVIGVGLSSITIDVPPGTTSATGTLTIKTPALGYEITHSTTYIRCYRSLDSSSRKFVLRVDDGNEITQPNWTASYSKKGRVTVFKDTTQLDLYGITGLNGTGVFNTYDVMPYWDYAGSKNHVVAGSGTTAQDGWFKWYYAVYNQNNGTGAESSSYGAGNRAYTIIGDTRGFWLMNQLDPTGGWITRTNYYFGEFESYFGSGDLSNCLLLAAEHYTPANTAISGTYTPNGTSWCSGANWTYGPSIMHGNIANTSYGTGFNVFKDYTGLGTSKWILPGSGIYFNTTSASIFKSGYDTGITYPNGLSYNVMIAPIYFKEYSTSVLRGSFPGVYSVHNNVQSTNVLNNNEFVDNVTNYSGKKFMSMRTDPQISTAGGSYGRILIDVTGPWRS